MPEGDITGTRIRDKRLALRLKQAELANACEISPSYLNLIEHNRRRISGALLLKIAARLGVDVSALSQGGDAALIEQLRHIKAAPVEADAESFVAQYPEWAAQLVAQSRRIEELERMVQSQNERLTHDPVLSEKMHEVLGAVASIRSTASILVETPGLDADWRARFHANINADSRRLAETSADMAAHFDQLTLDDASLSNPVDAVSAFFEARGFHVSELEEDGTLDVDTLLAQAPELTGQGAQSLGRAVLSDYAADAQALPFAAFSIAAAQTGYDPAALADQFDVDLPRVFRRLAALPRQPDRPEIGLVSCDVAGGILLRKPPTGFPMPRFGAACPLWPLFAALRSPGTPIRQPVQTLLGAGFMAYAVATPLGPGRFDAMPVLRAFMLLIEDAKGSEPRQTIGSSCRVCTAKGCRARREPSAVAQNSAPS